MSLVKHPGYRKNELFPEEYSCLGIVAPAGPVTPGKFRSACDFLTRLGVRFIAGGSILDGEKLSYLSAPRGRRLDDLNAMIRNPEVRAVYCLRGGYGCVHLLDGIDWAELKRRNLPVIGYSDITALHAAMVKAGAGVAVSACMGLNLEQDAEEAAFRHGFRRALGAVFHPSGEFRAFAQLRSCGGSGSLEEAPLFCGNLTVLTSLCGTPYLPELAGKVIFLEDIGEPVRKLDRGLMQLKMSGFFRGCAGVVFGDFEDCGDPGEQEELFRRFAAELSVPVFAGLHYGHCRRSVSLVCGETVRIRNGVLELRDPFSGKTP